MDGDDVARVISETLHVPRGDVSPETPIADLVQDSMDIVELIAVLTSTYGLDMDPAQLGKMKRVGDVERYVARHARRGGKKARLKAF